MFRTIRSGRLMLAPSVSTFTRAFTELPVVDVSALRRPDASLAERQAVGDALHTACRDVGFFYVKHHGVDQALCTSVRTMSRQWFALPDAKKAEIALRSCRRRGFRGYQALGANVTRYDGGFQRDWHEAIDLYKHFDEHHPHVVAGRPLHGPNPWPTQLPGFAEIIRQYVRECNRLGADLMRGISLGLGLEEDYFAGERAGDPFWVMRIIHYPPLHSSQPAAEAAEATAAAREAAAGGEVARSTQLSCGEHTDYGLLTMVNQDDGVTALQVKNAVGQWVDATPVSGTLVCNVGDMFKLWTNGLYQPTVHRVVNLSRDTHRISVPFFYEPNFDALVEPIPQLCGPPHAPSQRRLAGVRYGDHLQRKVFSNFELPSSAAAAS